MLHVIDGTWVPNDQDKANGLVEGFGVTIQIINGGSRVRRGGRENAQSLNRIAYYKESYANYLKVPIADDEVLGRANMKQFDEGGAGALPIYWEEGLGWARTPLTARLTPASWWATRRRKSAFKQGDYAKGSEPLQRQYHRPAAIENEGHNKPWTRSR